MSSTVGARIDGVDVSAYQVPTATGEESDGTLVWDSTVHIEYFFDHYRIEADARRYQV